MILLKKVRQTCSGCPSQWDAWDINGQYYYLRYRHGHGRIEQRPGPDPATWFPINPDYPDGDLAVVRSWDDGTDGGVIDLADFLTAAGDVYLAEDAVVRTEDSGDARMPEEPAPPAAPTEPAPDPTIPAPLSQGSYALFETPDGGRHLVAHPLNEEPLHFPIPPMILTMAKQAMDGKMPGGLLGGAFAKLFNRAGK